MADSSAYLMSSPRGRRAAPCARKNDEEAAAVTIIGSMNVIVPDRLHDEAVLDMAAIERILDMQRRGAAGLLVRLCRLFVESSARLVDGIEAGLAQTDSERLRQAAHTLKSASANLGAARLAGHCAEIERLARSGRIDEAAERWPAVRADYELALTALRALAGAAGPAHGAGEVRSAPIAG